VRRRSKANDREAQDGEAKIGSLIGGSMASRTALILTFMLLLCFMAMTGTQVASAQQSVTPMADGSADYAQGEDAYKQGDYQKAFPLISKAANAGFVKAQLRLGEMYVTGKGTPKDEQKGFFWFTKAVEQGYTPAQSNLGTMFGQDTIVPQDYATAVEWFTKAAKRGDAGAQRNLAICYERGYGVKQSSYAAYLWFSLAEDNGDPQAEEGVARNIKHADNHGLVESYLGLPKGPADLGVEQAEAEQKREEAEREREEAERERARYTVAKVLKSGWVNITTTDANGYQHVKGGPLQRVKLLVGNPSGEHAVYLNGVTFDMADVVCLGGYDSHRNPQSTCPPLVVGSIYKLKLDNIRTNMTPDGAGGYDYKNLPYFYMDRADGGRSTWQILELCHGTDCVAVSTVNSR
jgi:hypothetical protein